MFLVGNWAPELQTDVKGGERVQVVRRRGKPKDKRETPDKDKSICDGLVFVSEREEKKTQGESWLQNLVHASMHVRGRV